MREFASEWGIDIEGLERQTTAYEGLARAYLETDVVPNPFAILAAKNLRRAAANAVVLGEYVRARVLFEHAAFAYLSAGRGYGALLLNFSARTQPFAGAASAVQDTPILLWTLPNVIDEFLGSDDTEQMLTAAEAAGDRPVGVSALPSDILVDLFVGLRKWHDSNVDTPIVRPLSQLLLMYELALRRARRNRHHWRLLQMPFHPADPDLFAVMFALEMSVRTGGYTLGQLLAHVPLSEETKVIVGQTVDRLIDASHTGGSMGAV